MSSIQNNIFTLSNQYQNEEIPISNYKLQGDITINDLSSSTNTYNTSSYSIIESLLNNNDWSSSNEIVKLSIKSLFELSKQQSESIKSIEKGMFSKINKNECYSLMKTKASHLELNKITEEIRNSTDNLNEIRYQLEEKLTVSHLEELKNEVKNLKEMFLKEKDKVEDISKVILDDIHNIKSEFDDRISMISYKSNIENEKIEKINVIIEENKEEKLNFHKEIKNLHGKTSLLNDSIEKINKSIVINDKSIKELIETSKSLSISYETSINEYRNQSERIINIDKYYNELVNNIKSEFELLFNLNERSRFEQEELKKGIISDSHKINRLYKLMFKEKEEGEEKQEEDMKDIVDKYINSNSLIEEINKKLDFFIENQGETERKLKEIVSIDLIERVFFEIQENSYKNLVLDSNLKYDSLSTQVKTEISEITNRLNDIKTEIISTKSEKSIISSFDTKLNYLSDLIHSKISVFSEENSIRTELELKLKEEMNELYKIYNYYKERLVLEEDYEVKYHSLKEDVVCLIDKYSLYMNENEKLTSIMTEMKNIYMNKADIDEVNKALTSIHDELDLKVNIEEIEGKVRQNIKEINRKQVEKEGISNGNHIKLVWSKKNNTSNRNHDDISTFSKSEIVIWDIVKFNSSKEIFNLTEKNEEILIKTDGLYEIFICFLIKNKQIKPLFQLLINNNPVLSSSNDDNVYMYNLKNYIIDESILNLNGMYSENFVIKEYFYLKNESKVSLSFNSNAELGVMMIKKIN